MSAPRYRRVAAIVRDQITDGTLAPGAPAPSGAALSRMTGYSVPTCRQALDTLIADGALVPGASRNARPRVPATDHHGQTLADAKRALSAALATHRRTAGLTQAKLAERIGLSVTTIGHAETGRTWQSRPFWELADKLLNASGELLRLHDACRAAEVASNSTADDDEGTTPETEGTQDEASPAESPAVITLDVPGPVKSVAITWANGTITTVHPPTPTPSTLPSESPAPGI